MNVSFHTLDSWPKTLHIQGVLYTFCNPYPSEESLESGCDGVPAGEGRERERERKRKREKEGGRERKKERERERERAIKKRQKESKRERKRPLKRLAATNALRENY